MLVSTPSELEDGSYILIVLNAIHAVKVQGVGLGLQAGVCIAGGVTNLFQ